jgi:segregation and condensation protein B
MSELPIKHIIEAAIMAAEGPITVNQLMALFEEEERPETLLVRDAITELQAECSTRAVELKEVASGFRFQAKQDYAPWVKKLWEERPPRYSRAFLETLVLIAYRQPVTRAEIEEIRGVAVNSQIIKTLAEREWIKVLGHRDVPGRPALLGTTKQFLDYFNLKGLNDLPTLQELQDLDARGSELEKQLELVSVSANDAPETADADAEPQAEPVEQISTEVLAQAQAIVDDVEADANEMSLEEEVFLSNSDELVGAVEK